MRFRPQLRQKWRYVFLFPIWIRSPACLVHRLVLGAQDVSRHVSGAYTGEVAASMLAEFGCRYVIVGHSERRALHGETDALVSAKFAAVQQMGMTPILCLEMLEERQAGATLEVVFRQLDAVVAAHGVAGLKRQCWPTSRSGLSVPV